jgi:hypothetical protein
LVVEEEVVDLMVEEEVLVHLELQQHFPYHLLLDLIQSLLALVVLVDSLVVDLHITHLLLVCMYIQVEHMQQEVQVDNQFLVLLPVLVAVEVELVQLLVDLRQDQQEVLGVEQEMDIQLVHYREVQVELMEILVELVKLVLVQHMEVVAEVVLVVLEVQKVLEELVVREPQMFMRMDQQIQ